MTGSDNHSGETTSESEIDVVLLEFTGKVAMRNYITMLANALKSKHGIERVEIVTNDRFDRPGILKEQIRVRRFDFPESLIRSMIRGASPFFQKTVVDLIDDSNPDVVHVVSEIRAPAPVLYSISRLFPMVLTVHEPDPYVPAMFRRLVLNPIQALNTRLLGRFADRVFVHGQHSMGKLTELGVTESKIRIYPHGSFAPFYTKFNVDWGSDDFIHVLYFGRIFPGKGIEHLLVAAELLEKTHSRVKFTIAGSGDINPLRERIRNLSNIRVLNNYINDTKVAELFEQSDIVVLPYTAGSQSGVIGIAAGYSTPVIATNVGNFQEYIRNGESGILVPPEDGESIATAIGELVENPERRRKLGMTAKSDYQGPLSWDETATKILSEYSNIQINEPN